MTDAGNMVGTPQYMGPEQLAGLAADHRSDVYAAGLVVFSPAPGRAVGRRAVAAMVRRTL